MCEPVSIMMAVSTAAGLFAQKKSADAQASALEGQYEAQAEQTKAKAFVEKTNEARAAQKERARMITLAGESGTAGGSLAQALRTSVLNESVNQGNIDTNAINTARSLGTQLVTNTSRIQQPNYLQGALQIGASAYRGYQGNARPGRNDFYQSNSAWGNR